MYVAEPVIEAIAWLEFEDDSRTGIYPGGCWYPCGGGIRIFNCWVRDTRSDHLLLNKSLSSKSVHFFFTSANDIDGFDKPIPKYWWVQPNPSNNATSAWEYRLLLGAVWLLLWPLPYKTLTPQRSIHQCCLNYRWFGIRIELAVVSLP